MEQLTFGPEPEYKSTMMFTIKITTAILVLCQAPLIMFVPEKPVQIVFSITLGTSLLVMALIALWIPAFYRTLEYSIDMEGVRMKGGVFWKRRVTVPFNKITNVDITQGPVERLYRVGTVHVQTAGAGGAQGAYAEIRLAGVRDTDNIRDRVLDGMRVGNPASAGQSKEMEEIPGARSDVFERILAELTAMRRMMESGRR